MDLANAIKGTGNRIGHVLDTLEQVEQLAAILAQGECQWHLHPMKFSPSLYFKFREKT